MFWSLGVLLGSIINNWPIREDTSGNCNGRSSKSCDPHRDTTVSEVKQEHRGVLNTRHQPLIARCSHLLLPLRPSPGIWPFEIQMDFWMDFIENQQLSPLSPLRYPGASARWTNAVSFILQIQCTQIKQLHKAATASILTSVIQDLNVRKQPGENLKPSLLDYADSAVKQTRFSSSLPVWLLKCPQLVKLKKAPT